MRTATLPKPEGSAPRRLLFVCSRNRLRSPTAAAVFANVPGFTAVSAGLTRDADTRVSADLIEWANEILVMEATHRVHLGREFRELMRSRSVHVLGIPDDYALMQPELVALIRDRVAQRLNLDRSTLDT